MTRPVVEGEIVDRLCGFSDAEIRRELWRAENPGLSLARGMLIALAASVAVWAMLAGALALLLFG